MMNAKCALISDRAAVLPDFHEIFGLRLKLAAMVWSLEFERTQRLWLNARRVAHLFGVIPSIRRTGINFGPAGVISPRTRATKNSTKSHKFQLIKFTKAILSRLIARVACRWHLVDFSTKIFRANAHDVIGRSRNRVNKSRSWGVGHCLWALHAARRQVALGKLKKKTFHVRNAICATSMSEKKVLNRFFGSDCDLNANSCCAQKSFQLNGRTMAETQSTIANRKLATNCERSGSIILGILRDSRHSAFKRFLRLRKLGQERDASPSFAVLRVTSPVATSWLAVIKKWWLRLRDKRKFTDGSGFTSASIIKFLHNWRPLRVQTLKTHFPRQVLAAKFQKAVVDNDLSTSVNKLGADASFAPKASAKLHINSHRRTSPVTVEKLLLTLAPNSLRLSRASDCGISLRFPSLVTASSERRRGMRNVGRMRLWLLFMLARCS